MTRPLADLDALPAVPSGWRTVESLTEGERARWEAARQGLGSAEREAAARAARALAWLREQGEAHHWALALAMGWRRPEAAEVVRRLCRDGAVEAVGLVTVRDAWGREARVRVWRVR